MPARTVVLEVNEIGRGTLVIDGEPVRNCRATQIDARVGEITTVTLELIDVVVRVTAQVDETAIVKNVTTIETPGPWTEHVRGVEVPPA